MILDAIGIVIMAVLGGARLYQMIAGEWWVFPLFAHAMISAFLLILRGKTDRKATVWQKLVAWISALLPFAIQVNVELPILLRALSISGVAFAVWTIVVLGRSFDVAPADRGLVVRGPYNLVRHPMYASEIFSTVMVAAAEMTLWNFLVISLLVATIVVRIRWEEGIISEYSAYSDRVRARLLPGVW